MMSIADKSWLPRPALHDAQEQFRFLKERLLETSKELQHRPMTELEQRFFFRPLEKARTRLHAKWNSNPFNSHWFQELYDAQGDLKHGRFELAEFKKKQQ